MLPPPVERECIECGEPVEPGRVFCPPCVATVDFGLQPRLHLVTHPVLGVVSWRSIVLESDARGRICRWCFKPAPEGRRTRCGSPECAEMIWQASSWGRCRTIVLREEKTCRLCDNRAAEVDHIVPVSLGGTGDRKNLRGLCTGCHKTETSRLRRERQYFVAAEAWES